MLSKSLPACGLCVIVLVAEAAGAVSAAAPYALPKEQAGNAALTAQLVKTGLYMFSGSSNSLVRMSANGLIVVDGPAPEHYDALLKRVHRMSEQPVRLVINTDHHPEHTASNARFIADGAQVLAHDNVAKNMGSADAQGGKAAPLTKTYDRELSVPLGGIEVRVMHFGNAHTNGDSVVYFPNLKVVAVGDLYAATPDPDFASGGSLVGWGPVLAEVLKLDFDVVVPGTGPTVSRADLATFKTRIETLVSRATALVKQGVPRNQLMAQLQTDDLGWQITFTEAQLESFYTELSQTK